MAAAKLAIGESLKDREQRDAKAVSTMVARCFDSEDYREGVRAFLENAGLISRAAEQLD